MLHVGMTMDAMQLVSFWTLAVDGRWWLASRSGHFTFWESTPNTGWTEDWLGHKTGTEEVTEIKIPVYDGIKSRSQSSLSRHCTKKFLYFTESSRS
jgi:outer membrane protease